MVEVTQQDIEFEYEEVRTVIIRNYSFEALRDWARGKIDGFDNIEPKIFQDLDKPHQDQEVARMKKYFREHLKSTPEIVDLTPTKR